MLIIYNELLMINHPIGTSFVCVSSWIIRVYTILVWNAISGSSNLAICFYYYLILTLIFHLKVLINFFFIFFIIIIIIIIIITIIVVVVVVLLLSIIYTINLPVVRPGFSGLFITGFTLCWISTKVGIEVFAQAFEVCVLRRRWDIIGDHCKWSHGNKRRKIAKGFKRK